MYARAKITLHAAKVRKCSVITKKLIHTYQGIALPILFKLSKKGAKKTQKYFVVVEKSLPLQSDY